tara:strand:+ start:6187 stop:7074 length:888 start_codon:yes stop_codon:yes gene_type:complete
MILSIIMAVYNEESYIRESINSILSQQHEDFELIIVDDGSTDKTAGYIENYLEDQRIKYINEGKIGKVEAFNIGFKESKGQFICFFHGDDIMTSKSIVSRLDYIKSIHDKPVAVAGKLKTISNIKKFDSILIPKGKHATFSGQSIMFSRILGDLIFPIPKSLPNEDYWMRLHIDVFSEKIFHTREIVALYRIHENNSFLSSDTINNFNKKSEKIHVRRIQVASAFLGQYKKELSKDFIKKIEIEIKAENYRYNGRIIKLFFSSLSLKRKLSFIIESNRFFYKIKNIYPNFFIGWG